MTDSSCYSVRQKLTQLCDNGYHNVAWDLGVETFGPLGEWPGAVGQELACQIALHFGLQRIYQVLVRRGYQRYPNHRPLLIRYGHLMLARRGALYTFEWLDRIAPLQEASVEEQMEWLHFQSIIYTYVRDFTQSQQYADSAARLRPNAPAVLQHNSKLAEMQDRYEEALQIAESGIAQYPDNYLCLKQLTHILTLCGQEARAMSVLQQFIAKTQNVKAWSELIVLQLELKQYQQAIESLDRLAQCLPSELTKLDPSALPAWICAMRCDLACIVGDLPMAQEQGKNAAKHLAAYQNISARLLQAESFLPQKLLDVAFIRQHHKTCAPATLTVIAQYWGEPADHLSIADEICYDGTSHYSERKWAEQQGWLAREFTIDWDSACLLIDKEIPFTLTTTETASAHLQTVIGYSPLRETLICRDPYRRLQVEFEAADLFCSEAPYGIRGMVLIPANQKARLAGVNLPDEALWDALHEVNAALDSHDRPRAANAWLGLRETAPDHLLTLQAERTIASYDSNLSVILNIEEKILERYPDDTRRQLSKASLLRDLKTKREHQQWVEEISRHNPDNPYIRLNLAAQLQQQHASYAESERLLRRVMRQLNAQDGAVWTQFANLRWKQQRRSEALQYYRYASTLQYADESAAESYFQALHCLKQTDSGLSYLQQRHHDLGQYSPLPTITLCEQYERLGRVDEALPLLAGATERHPSDGGLLLFTANMWSRVGEQAKAEALLEQSRPFCNRSQWLQTTEAVLLRSGGGDNQTALALLQEAAELEPLNSNLHNKVTQKLYILHGREKALAWLKTTVDRFPHHKQLNGLYAFWLKKVSDERLETALRHLLVIDPDYQWAIRELAYCLSDGKRFDEAQEILSRAVQLAPNQAETAIAQGFLAARIGSQADAHRCYRQALCLDIDQEYPAYQLISACRSLNERIAEVTFFCQQLQLQNSQGEALLTLQDIGQNSLSPDALLEQLVRFHQQCPELWQSGVAVARQLIKMLRFPEAVAQLEQSTNDFPLLSEIPYELAQICFSEQRYDECLQSLQQVLRLDPWSEPAVKLAVRAHINLEKGLEAAYELLEQSLQFTPESVELIILKGIVLWRQDRPDAAIQALTQAIWLDTGSDWAWSTLQQYARGLDDEHYLYRLSHEIAQQRPNDVDACLALAQYTQVKAEQERALQTVLTLAPRHIAGHEAYLHLLLEQWRYDEMTPHFSTELWGERPPLEIEIFRARQYYRLGQHQLAIEQAQAILSEDPENYNLWRELADWLEQREDWGAFLIAAENMVRLRPESCVALGGYLAAAHHRLGQLQEAKRYYRQALQYEPEYTYALTHFFDLLFQTGAIDEAKALWALQQQHVYLVIGCGLQLAARTQDEALRQELLIERISNNKIDEQCWRESSKVIEELALDEPLIQHITDRLSADRPINTPALLYWLGQHSQYDGLDINLARRHLEQSVAAAPNQKELNAWLIYLLWDQHEGEAALTRLEQVLTQHTDDNWCWARLKEYGEKNEQPLRAYQFAHHLVTQHPNNEHAWLALITLSSDEQKEDIYARFVQLFPRHINGHERYLKLLLEQTRFDDMLPYLTITYWGGYIPAVIQVLAANRLVALGQRQEAMSMLESTVQTTPDDRTLWSALADIYRHEEIKNYDGYLYACQQLLRLDPKYYVHFGYVAHAYLLKQDKVAAVPYLEKAIALESNYSFASENLFDIQLENEDFNAAKKTLNIISKYESDGYCGLRMLKLALKIDDKNMLNTGMALILADLEMSNIERHWQTVLTLLAEEKLPLLDTAIENALLERQEAAWVVMNWWLLRHRLSEPQKQVIEAVMQKCTDGKAVLAREVLSSIGNWEDEQQVPYLTGFIQRHGQCLRADAIAHAKVSYAFSSHTHAQEIIDWMSDWQREDIRPWCLSNLLNALFIQRKNKRLILRVAQLNHKLQPDNPDSAIWLCAALMLQGAAPARIVSLLDGVSYDSLTRHLWQGLYHLAQGYVALLRDNNWEATASHFGNALQYNIDSDKAFLYILNVLKWHLFGKKGFKAMRLLSATEKAYAGFKAYNAQNYDLAAEKLEPLAHFLSERPVLYLGYIYSVQQQHEKMMYWLRLGVEHQVPGTYYNLALALHDGRGAPRDYRQALRYFHLAVKHDNEVDAHYMLGCMYQTGAGYRVSLAEAAHQFHAAAELGHTLSAFKYAAMLYSGEGIEQNYQQAAHWFKRAGDGGDIDGQNAYAYCLYEGLGVEQDQQAAVQLCLPLAEQGLIRAQYILGMAYESGESGLPKDQQLSLKWYMAAAEQGDANAQCKMGDLFTPDEATSTERPDYNAALEWYHKAAEQNNIGAIHRLGWMHEEGLGVEADLEQATQYYLKSAEQGLFESCYQLALLFAGQGRFTQAEHWLERAGEAGDDQQKLIVSGEFMDSAHGIPANQARAVFWADASAKMDNHNALVILAALHGHAAVAAYSALDEGEELDADAQYARDEACYWAAIAFKHNPDSVLLLYILGLIHYCDENIEEHNKKAINYLQRVVELEKKDRGHRHNACRYLSAIYEASTSSYYDLQQSHFYLYLAAQEKNGNAQYQIGQLYLNPAFALHSPQTGWLWLHESLHGAHGPYGEMDAEEREVVEQQMADVYQQLTDREQQAVQEIKEDWLGVNQRQIELEPEII